MKIFTILILALTFNLNLFAQPNYSIQSYRLQGGKKTNHYLKKSKNYLKNGDYNKVVMNAAYALKIANKKNHISSAQKYLNDNYNRAINQNINRIEQLKESTVTFEGDHSVTEMAEIIVLYKTMRDINSILSEVPPKSFKPAKRKDTGFRPEIEDYKNDIEIAKDKLEKAKAEAATMHYSKGRELENKGDKQSAKMAAKQYRWANEYSPNYRDASERYEEVRKLGTTRMGLLKFESSGSQYGDVGAIISDKLLIYLAKKAANLEFFEIIDRTQLDIVVKEQQLAISGLMDESTTAEIGELHGVNVLLVGNVTKNYIDRQKLGPSEKKYSAEVTIRKEKYLDNKGKERTRDIKGTVHAKAKIYDKIANAFVGCSYKVLDVKTGTILASGSATGTDDWNASWVGSFTGDERAIRFMSKDEPNYPSFNQMINTSSNRAANQVYSVLVRYAEKVGK